MKVFVFTGFEGHYPVGTAAMVVAEDLPTAWDLLSRELENSCLPALNLDDEDVVVVEVDTKTQNVAILLDGNY